MPPMLIFYCSFVAFCIGIVVGHVFTWQTAIAKLERAEGDDDGSSL